MRAGAVWSLFSGVCLPRVWEMAGVAWAVGGFCVRLVR
eukprot:COSAG02_NODE_66998_length_254_cov_0.651613_2_plen_37_part_01